MKKGLSLESFGKYDCLLFDLDNTLLDFSKCSKLSFQQLISHFNLDPEIDHYSIYSPINAKFWNYFERQKIDAQSLHSGRFSEYLTAIESKIDAQEMADKYLHLLIKNSSWIDGAEQLLNLVRKSHEMHIVTNGLSNAQHKRIEKHNMKKFFKHIFVSEEIGVSKPHSGFFEYVDSRILTKDKSKVLVIGDNPKSDIKGAQNFGYDSCWFNYKKSNKPILNANLKVNSWIEFLKEKNA